MTAPDAPAPTFAAVLVMAGSGSRLGAAVPKAFVRVLGRPLWRHAAETLASVPGCRAVVLAAPADRVDEVREASQSLGVPATVVAGGARRQDSVRLAVAAAPADVAVIAIHDAARPLLSAADAAAVVAEAARCGAALAATPVRDTLKSVVDGAVSATVPRDGLWHAQTPQAFDAALVRRAHRMGEERGLEVTDDAQLVEALGLGVVRVVRCDPWNFKITEPRDRDAAEAILGARSGAGGVSWR